MAPSVAFAQRRQRDFGRSLAGCSRSNIQRRRMRNGLSSEPKFVKLRQDCGESSTGGASVDEQRDVENAGGRDWQVGRESPAAVRVEPDVDGRRMQDGWRFA